MDCILVPLQGFPAEVNSINLAFHLAEYSKAKVGFLHCLEKGAQTDEFWLDRLMGHAKSLSMLLDVPFEFERVSRPRASDAILVSSKVESCSLLIMTAAHQPIYKQLLGSTSRRVTRKSKVPTLVVASWMKDFDKHQEPVIRKILLPIRNTIKDLAPLRLAAALKKSSAAQGAELIALHVTLLPMITSLAVTESIEFQRERKRFLDDCQQFTEQTNLKVTPRHVAARKIGDATIEIAAHENVDLIILGARRRPRRFRGILGRVSRKIALKSQAAVVLTFAP